MRKICWLLVVWVAVTGLLLSSPSVSGQERSAGTTHVVEMDNMDFGMMPEDAKVGDSIIWVNKDTVQHTATARDGSFDVRLQPGERGRTVLKKAGRLAIYCIYHPMMRATLRVAAS